jgi:hypothetical protein
MPNPLFMGFPPTMQEGTRLLLTNRAAHPRDSESFRRRRARLSKLIGRCCHTERGTHSPVWPFPPVNIAAPLTGVAERTRSGEPSGSAHRSRTQNLSVYTAPRLAGHSASRALDSCSAGTATHRSKVAISPVEIPRAGGSCVCPSGAEYQWGKDPLE